MLKITPLNIEINYLDLGFLLSWPDTTAVNMTFFDQGTKIAVVLDSAAVTVVDDIDAQAIRSELSEKQGMVKVNVVGHDENLSIFVGQIRDHEDGPLFMCLGGTDKLVPDNFELYSREIWSAKD